MKSEFAQSTATESFLRSVEREAAVLPADRRGELLADLAEHIHVALAERPGQEQAVLAELGDPRAIVGTALESVPAADRLPNPSGAVKALRVLLWVSLVIAAIAVVGIALGNYDLPVYVEVLTLLPVLATAVHVFFLRPGRPVLRVTLTVTTAVWILGVIVNLLRGAPGAVVGALVGVAILVLLHQRSTRAWLTGATAE
ncbi:hypothetical protein HZZ00_36290 [Streptomyces sp. NEAU-sy36]|uniref:HAAS signaling domain-containing protein n=1 Tax=unclassified Streptomyces TaxID=2593676 RepID=UPI0015D60E39|nr:MULTISPECIES: hypothetical protein [unclassified Streptomyces]QLJ05933.1 hypothetical protein HZZ00_36290 [Streptomyces sp. NEAU-sy36]